MFNGASSYMRRYQSLVLRSFLSVGSASLVIGCVNKSNIECDMDPDCGVHYEDEQTLTNWSSTHACLPKRVYEPKSAQEVVRVLQMLHEKGERIRPVGTALSPNGIGMSSAKEDCVISLAAIDHILVDEKKRQVTVGAGAKVSTVLSELKKYGLTLQNFSSIQEQQIAGWTQVAAHGTGSSLSTVDDMITRMTIATPLDGLITLSDTANPWLFRFARVGLGSIGVVTELRLSCMPQIELLEQTFVMDRNNASSQHNDRLKNYRHVRYMWIPYTNDVVAVVSNPIEKNTPTPVNSNTSALSAPHATAAMQALLVETTKEKSSLQPEGKVVEKMSFAQLRDVLLERAPLNLDFVKKVNAAEAEYWRASQGWRRENSTNILGFECGGEQLVLEVCFPIGSLDKPTDKDISFVRRLLATIEGAGIPAPAPIEQRWTARSQSPMSPAYSLNPAEVYSWVGIIMYLPTEGDDPAAQRALVRKKFLEYCALLEPLFEEYDAVPHWGKIEVPKGLGSASNDAKSLIRLRKRLAKRYPVAEFNEYRRAVDPKGILENDMIVSLFGDDM